MSSGSVVTTRESVSDTVISGSADDDIVNLTGTGQNVAVTLMAGEDQLNIAGGRYTRLTVLGGADDDQISGVGSLSLINGNTGDDILNLNVSAATGLTVFGGQGDDVFGSFETDENGAIVDAEVEAGSVQGRNLLIFGNIGNEVIDISDATGSNTVYGGQDSDVIVGSISGNDLLSGDLGSDTIFLGEGARSTIVLAGQGNDGIQAGGENDDGDVVANSSATIFGGQGNDSVGGSLNLDEDGLATSIDFEDGEGALVTSNSLLFGNRGNDSLFIDGDSDRVSVYGGQNNDTLVADDPDATDQGGNIFLSGDAGADIMVASGSNVTMSGGGDSDVFGVAGADVEETDPASGSTPTGVAADADPLLITDFQTGADSITFGGDAGVSFANSQNSNYVAITNDDADFQAAYTYVLQNRGSDDMDRYTFFDTGEGSFLFYDNGDETDNIQAVQLGDLTASQFRASDIVGGDAVPDFVQVGDYNTQQ